MSGANGNGARDEEGREIVPRDALGRFVPGHSGNPRGPLPRHLRSLESEILDLMGDEVAVPGLGTITRQRAIAIVFCDMLIQRDATAWRLFMDRVWPKIDLHGVFGFDVSDPEQVASMVDVAISGIAGAIAAEAGTREPEP